MDSELMKRMTGGDPILARFLHKEYFEFTAEFVPFIITNYLPVIDGADFALRRRILIVPFDTIIKEEDIIKNLEHILVEERNGIFNRILQAIEDYKENGLVIPDEISQKISHYVDSSNLFKRFFDFCSSPTKMRYKRSCIEFLGSLNLLDANLSYLFEQIRSTDTERSILAKNIASLLLDVNEKQREEVLSRWRVLNKKPKNEKPSCGLVHRD